MHQLLPSAVTGCRTQLSIQARAGSRQGWFLLSLLLLLLSGPRAWAQNAANYTFSTNATSSLALDRNGNAVDMSTGTTSLLSTASDDDGVSSVTTLPFTFIFMGQSFTQFSVSTNGLLGLGGTAVVASNFTVSSGTAALPLISAFAGDLRLGPSGSSSKVHYKTVGTAPNRTLLVEFANMNLTYTAPSTSNGTYQVRLYETSGVVEFVYGSMFRNAGTGVDLNSDNVGIGFAAGSTAGSLAYIISATNTNTNNSASFAQQTYPLSTNIANLHSTANGSRRAYVYVPPTVPTAPPSLSIDKTSYTSLKLNWTDASTTESGFAVYRSTDNVSFSFLTTVPSTTGSGTGTAYSYTNTGLTNGTTYYYRVLALSEGSSSAAVTGNSAPLTYPAFNSTNNTFTIDNTAATNASSTGGTNFNSFTDAITALNNGVITAATTFNVKAGQTFSETPPVITATGTSANTITFQKSGNGANPLISSTATSGAVIDVNGGDYFTFDGISITASSTGGYGYRIRNSSATTGGATNNTIQNATITLSRTVSGNVGVVVTSSSTYNGITPSASAGANAYTKLSNLTITNATNGIYAYAGSATTTLQDNNLEITNCTIGSASTSDDIGGVLTTGAYGMRVYQNYRLSIHDNVVQNVSGQPGYGIHVDQTGGTGTNLTLVGTSGNDASNVYNNRVSTIKQTSTSGTTAARGMHVGTLASGTHTLNVYNNIITDVRSAATSSTNTRTAQGLYLAMNGSSPTPPTTPTINAWHNTVFMTGQGSTSGSNACLEISSSTGGVVKIQNNLLVNTTGTQSSTGKHYCLVSAAATLGSTGSASNYNDLYYSTSAGGFAVLVGTSTTYANVTGTGSWSAASTGTQDANSLQVDPVLSSFKPTALAVDNKGTAVTVTTDILGVTRTSPPDMGAYEFNATDTTPPVITYTTQPSNTTSTSNQTVVATIADATSGIGANAAAPRLYYRRSTSTSWVSAVASSATGSSYTFTIDYAATGFGGAVASPDVIQYYVAAQDAASVPNGTSNPTGSVSVSPPGTVFTGTPNSYQILSTLSGDYYVGTSTSPAPTRTYSTLTAAAAVYNAGIVSGPVTFYLLDATYSTAETFPINFGANATAAAGSYTLTIKPNTGVTATVVNPTTSSTFKVTSGSYITFDGSNSTSPTASTRDLTLSNTSSSATAAALVWVASTTAAPASNIQIKNLVLQGVANTGSSNTSAGVMVSHTTYALATGANANTISISNNTVQGVSSGIVVNNDSSLPGTGLQITNNVLGPGTAATASNLNQYGIFVQQATSPTITDNTIQNIISTSVAPVGINLLIGVTGATVATNTISSLSTSSSGDVIGINLGTGCTGATINRNKVLSLAATNSFGYGAQGIKVSTGSASSSLVISNNFIANLTGSGFSSFTSDAIYGIGLQGTTGGVKLYGNSVSLSGSYNPTNTGTYVSAALYVATGVTGVDARNNVFANSLVNGTSSSLAYALYSAAAKTAFTTINYNDYYVGGSQAMLGNLGGDQATLALLKTATGQDANSLNYDPQFTSTTDLHTVSTNISNVGVAISPAIAGVTTVDIDGDSRSVTTPDMGADEFTAVDTTPPTITYTALATTTSTSNRTLGSVVIDDGTGFGVDAGSTVAANRPRLYFRRMSSASTALDANVVNDNTNATDGWKYVVADGTGSSPYTFTINYSLLYTGNGSGVTGGQYVQYFVVAQDVATTPNVGIGTLGTLPTGAGQPSSVALATANLPTGTLNSYLIQPLYAGSNYEVGSPASGTPGVTNFTSLTNAGGLFDALNQGTLTGNVTVSIISDLSAETGTNALNKLTDGGSNYTLTLQSDGPLRTISNGAATTNAAGLIRLSGASNVTISGGTGTTRTLLFRSTTASTPVFNLTNDLSAVKLNNLIVESVNTSATSGAIVIGNGTTSGNSNLTITGNDIRGNANASTGTYANGIYSLGLSSTAPNSNVTVSSNLIHNFTSSAVSLSSSVANSSSSWTIGGSTSADGNQIYQEASRTGTITAISLNTGATHTVRYNSIYQTAGTVAAFTGISIVGSGNGHTVSNNVIGGAAADASGTSLTANGVVNGISLAVGISSATSVQSNLIRNITNTSTTAITSGINATAGLLSIGTGSSTGTNTGNTIGDATASLSISAKFTLYGIYFLSSTTGHAATVQGNTVRNLQGASGSAASTLLYGMTINSTTKSTVQANTVRDLSIVAATGTNNCQIYGILINGSGSHDVLSNTVTGLANGSVASSGNTQTAGIVSFATGAPTLADNQISSLSLSSTTAAGSAANYNLVCGLSLSSGTAGTALRNRIWSLSSQAPAFATSPSPLDGVQGILMSGAGTSLVFANNQVAPGSGSAAGVVLMGILNASTGAGNALYYNSVYLTGSGTADSYGFRRATGTTASGAIRNNIFFNERSGTGSHYAIGYATAGNWTATTSNYNLLVAATAAKATSAAGTAGDFAAWKTNSAGDANSNFYLPAATEVGGDGTTASAAALFTAPGTGNLNINPSFYTVASPVESGGVSLASTVDTDYDGHIRQGSTGYAGTGTAPDLGADEYAGTPANNMAFDCATGVAVVQQTPTTAVYANTTNQAVLRIAITTTGGTSSPLSATSFTFSADGTTANGAAPASITNAKLFYSAGSTFVTTTPVGTTVAAPSFSAAGGFTFTTTQQLPLGTSYFFLTYDVPAGSLDGNVIDAVLSSVTVGSACAVPAATGSPNGSRSIIGPMHDDYTVGATTGTEAYASIKAALADLTLRGIRTAASGGSGVRLLLTNPSSKPYNTTNGETFPLVVNPYAGLSAATPLTIKPATGISPLISASSTTQTIQLLGADYVTLDGSNTNNGTSQDLTIENLTTGTTSSSVITLAVNSGDAATFNTVKNAVLRGPSTASPSFGVYVLSSNNNTISNNTLSKMLTGIQLSGTSLAAQDANNAVTNNTVGLSGTGNGFGSSGIAAQNQSNLTISGNTVQNASTSTATIGIDLTSNITTATVQRNTIKNLTSSVATSNTTPVAGIRVGNASSATAATTGVVVDANTVTNLKATNTSYGVYGIYLNTGTTNANLRVSNNMLTDLNGSNFTGFTNSSTAGIYLYSTATAGVAQSGISILHNSVNLTGTATYTSNVNTAALAVEVGSTGLTVQNNIFANSIVGATSSKPYALYSLATAASYTALDYNDYYSSGSQAAQSLLVYFGGTDQTTLTALRTATGKDANSISGNPQFTSTTDLHINATAGSVAESAGLLSVAALAGNDLDNQARGPYVNGAPNTVNGVAQTNGGGSAPDLGADEGDFAAPFNATVSAITYTQNNTNVYRNTTGQQVTGLTITATGTIGTVALNTITFDLGSTAVADILNPKLYSTTGSTYTSPTLVATTGTLASSYTLTLTTPVTLSQGANYFWLTYDVSATATGGNTVASVPTTVRVGTTDYTASTTPAITLSGSAGARTILGPMTGNYTVGRTLGTEAYASLTLAMADLTARGVVTGNSVIFLLTNPATTPYDASAAGGETFPITVPAPTLSTNQGVSIVPYNGTTNPLITGSSSTGLLLLSGTDYLTIDGNNGSNSRLITLRNSNTSGYAIRLVNDATNNIFRYLTLESANSSSSSGTVVFSTSTGTLGNSDNAITSCELRDLSTATGVPANAVYSLGTAGALNARNLVQGNIIRNFTGSAVMLSSTGAGNSWQVGGSSSSLGNLIYQEAARTGTLTSILLAGGSSHTVGYNSIYQTTGSVAAFTGISITGSGTGHTVSNNTIGGATATASGSSLAATGAVVGINLAVGGTLASGATNVQSNLVRNITTTTTSGNVTGITASSGAVNIGPSTGATGGNTIGDATASLGLTATATSYGINLTTGTVSSSVRYNTVSNLQLSSTTSGTTATAGASVYGILVSGSTSAPTAHTISYNTVSNVVALDGTTKSQRIILRGIMTTGGASATSIAASPTVDGNQITNVLNNSVTINSASTSTIGLLVSSVGLSQVRGNQVSGIASLSTAAPTSTGSNVVYGLYLADAATGSLITGNRFWNVYASSAGTGSVADLVVGFMLVGTASGTVANNQIVMGAGPSGKSALIDGILDVSTGTLAYYYNSVYLAAGDGLSDTFAYEHFSTSTVTLRNNIFYNGRTVSSGGTNSNYAIANTNTDATGWNSSASNYNLLLAVNSAKLAYWLTGSRTFATWKTSSGSDGSSLSETSTVVPATNLFSDVTTGNLNIKPASTEAWYANGTGVQVPSVSTEYDSPIGSTAAVRSLTVAGGGTDIGADEFTPTSTPPALNVSAAPALGGTQVFSLGGRTLATVVYGSTGTVPTSVTASYYSGTNPPSPARLRARYTNSYFSFADAGNGSNFSYTLTLAYDPALLGTVTDEASLRLSQYASAAWGTDGTSTVNTTARTVSSPTPLTSFDTFAGSDLNFPLPVELMAFEAVRQGQQARLSWTTASEKNNRGFEVQLSTDGRQFQTLTFVAGAGNSSTRREYAYLDQAPGKDGLRYYRLRQLDLDGQESFSPVRTLRFEATGLQLTAAPNPFYSQLTLSVRALPTATITELTATDATGRTVLQRSLALPAGSSEVELPELGGLPAGVYLLHFRLGAERYHLKVVKN